MYEITSIIKQLRKKKGLTQKTMAERLHMARSTYSKIESGNTALNYERLVNISKVLNVPLTEIIIENGDSIFKSIAEEFSLMLHLTEYWLSEKLYRMVAYKDLKPEHKKLLQEKGFNNQEAYENTPLGGRIYEFGPRDVFRFIVENCGMDVLFRRNMILDDYWNCKWKKYLKEKSKTSIDFNADEQFYIGNKNTIEIDDTDYFLVYMIELKMPGNKNRHVQFAERDFPEGVDEWGALDYLKVKTGALDGDILCFSIDGYEHITEIIK